MAPQDRDAMRLAIETLRADPELRDSIEGMLRDQGEQAAGTFAAGLCQVRSLKLKAWECPPADSFNVEAPSDHYGARPNEVALLRRMLVAGVSRYDPNPLAAIQRAERERAA